MSKAQRRRRKSLPLLDGDGADHPASFTLQGLVSQAEDPDGPSIEDELIRCSRSGDPDPFAPLDVLIPPVEMGR